MNAKFQFTNLVYVTMKKYNETRAMNLEDCICDFATRNKLKIMLFKDGWIMSWELAKHFARNLHFHCSRIFDFNEVMDMCANEVVTMADIETAQIA